VRVQFVIGSISSFGGTERVTSEIASSLSSAGHEVSIVSLFGSDQPWFEIPDTIPVSTAGLRPAGGSLRKAAAISHYLFRLANRQDVDVLVLVDSILFAFCLPWVMFSKARIVCWEHFNLSTSHGAKMRNIARLAASRLSSRVVVLTERDAEAWRSKYRISDRVQSIWNPIPRFEAGYADSLGNDSRVALAVGRLTPQKGFDILLRAWQILCFEKEGWTLRIVGGGEEEQALKALATDLGISDSVIFVGQVRDVAAEYRQASLYVMSSRWEGLPMTLLEAQHFGLPCVSTDCLTGPREVLCCGNGILVKVDDPVDLARGMAELISSPALRLKKGAAARENAGRFAAGSIVKQWEQLLGELL